MNGGESSIGLVIALLLLAGGAAAIIWDRHRRKQSQKDTSRDSYTEGLQQMLAGRHVDAISSFTEAVRTNTANLDAYFKLGELYRILKRPKRAAQIHLEMSVRSEIDNPMKASIYRELAIDWEQAGSIDKSLHYLDLARHAFSNHPDELRIRLRLLEKQNDWDEAARTLHKLTALTKKPNPHKLAQYKIQEGEAIAKENEHDARIKYKEALKLDSQSQDAMLYIARSYIHDGREDDAQEWLSRFITERPEDAHLAMPMLEKLLYELGRFSEIEVILRASVEKAPGNRDIRIILIDLLNKKGEYQDALEVCERGLDITPDDLNLKLQRLSLLRHLNESNNLGKALDEMVSQSTPTLAGYFCRECGHHTDDYIIHCTNCGAWGSFNSERRRSAPAKLS